MKTTKQKQGGAMTLGREIHKPEQLKAGERWCYECKYAFLDATEEYKLCPKCGSPTVIRPERLDTGVKLLEFRTDVYEALAPLFDQCVASPEFRHQNKQVAAERVIGLVCKKFCH